MKLVTKPMGVCNYIVYKEHYEGKKKAFVASGEQSFLYLINKGFLPSRGRFHTITPCMRNDSFDEKHTKYFMKLELINYDTNITRNFNRFDVNSMMQDAKKFFEQNVYDVSKLKVEEQQYEQNALDINYEREDTDDVELGSYGLRECSFLKWVYGTGLAEPRFSRMTRV